ncbi:5-oxoprolinase subunit C family protein [Thalassobius sp. S69A]|uniref:5-oxoprolinase subunit C family protein n=1 Tax=unclassified Thalassovita TaxID=2619711 RepID=UPI000C0CE300|nr:urea amidolyase [Paracoccaceae bacterium]
MTRQVSILKAGPGITCQDRGRPGYLAYGLSRGGAADILALSEGAALLGQSPDLGAIEMPGMGGDFRASQDMRIALTGAQMTATLDGAPLAWNASHLLGAGQVLSIGPARRGTYGYLTFGGGLAETPVLGSLSSHLAAGLGQGVQPGTVLHIGADHGTEVGMTLPPEPRFGGGEVRVLPSLQTDLFDPAQLQRFEQTEFHRDHRGNRMGLRMVSDGAGFRAEGGLTALSEVIVPGDIQITGDGTPFVLMAECQTTGGYPRIGTVLPCDLPRVAQAMPGDTIRFAFVTREDAYQAETRARAGLRALGAGVRPLLRDPADMPDLLSYQLISGMIAGTEEP